MKKHPTQVAFDRAAKTYDENAVAQQEIGDRLLERLQFIRLNPEAILDLGTGTGFLLPRLHALFPEANITGVDVSNESLKLAKKSCDYAELVQADGNDLPFPNQSFDVVISNLMLPWSLDLMQTFSSCLRVLKKNGLLIFTTVGVDTLKELRQAFAQVDSLDHVNHFYDMHELGDGLAQAGFADPVMDMEYLTVTYRNLNRLFTDLKQTGSHVLPARAKQGLYSPSKWKKMLAEYERFKNEDGVYPATVEIVYGHAFKPERSAQRKDATGAVAISIDEIKRK